MYNFLDLISKSYLKLTKEKKDNIAVFYFQEYNEIKYEGKYIFIDKEFYTELEGLLTKLIKGAYDRHFRFTYFEDNFDMKLEAEKFKIWEDAILSKHQDVLDGCGIDYVVERYNWEEIEDVNFLNEALDNGLILNDPIRIIEPSKEVYSKGLVLRKSKLEYLKSEVIRARKALNIEELNLSKIILDTAKHNNSNDFKPNREEVLDGIVLEAFKIIKPLGGIYITEELLNNIDIKRLNDYTRSIIVTGKISSELSSFPKLNIPAQFIRKTLHKVYVSIGKKHKLEFIKLIHLFEQFEDVDPSTTSSKFSTYEGAYENILNKISF